jgi:hypothetical protein
MGSSAPLHTVPDISGPSQVARIVWMMQSAAFDVKISTALASASSSAQQTGQGTSSSSSTALATAVSTATATVSFSYITTIACKIYY